MITIDPVSGGPPLVEIGVGGTFAILLIDKVLAFIKSRSSSPDEVLRLVRELHDERREILEEIRKSLEAIRMIIASQQPQRARSAR